MQAFSFYRSIYSRAHSSLITAVTGILRMRLAGAIEAAAAASETNRRITRSECSGQFQRLPVFESPPLQQKDADAVGAQFGILRLKGIHPAKQSVDA